MRQHTGRSPIAAPLTLALAALLAATGCTRQEAAPGNGSAAASASNVPDAGSRATPQPAAADAAAGSSPLMVATEGASAPYVADSAGIALYALDGDRDGSRCTGECTQTWPPALVEGATPSDSPGLQAGMVGVVQRADGGTQVAYDGHPLYRYGGDAGTGTAGHGVSDKWGHWSLVSPQGTPLPETR